ncbi:PIN domain-containing protein [Patescibacteria group bacterium]|nr:PIN domain-containing protein [Patescibacteria group bacterium]
MLGKIKTLDTNLLIRFFTQDNPAQADAVEKLLRKAAKDELLLPDIIIAEIVWVLLSFYELEKEEVIEKLEGLFSLENVKMNRNTLKRTIDLYRRYNISFTDAYLAAYTLEEEKSDQIYSFDRGLDKVKEITRLKP